MNIQILSTSKDSTMFVNMKNEPEEVYLLLKLAQDNATIQKYFWRSIFDSNEIEYIEPKIYDAFTFELTIIGELENLKYIISEYQKRVQIIKKLPKFKLSKEEINEFANKLYGLIYN